MKENLSLPESKRLEESQYYRKTKLLSHSPSSTRRRPGPELQPMERADVLRRSSSTLISPQVLTKAPNLHCTSPQTAPPCERVRDVVTKAPVSTPVEHAHLFSCQHLQTSFYCLSRQFSPLGRERLCSLLAAIR